MAAAVYARALGEYEQAVRLDPDNPTPRENLARVLLKLGRCEPAAAQMHDLGKNASEELVKAFEQTCPR